jgi:hypothetical protein
MRWFLAVSLVAGVAGLAGCTDGVAPPNLTNDDLGVGDLGDEDMTGVVEDLLPPPADLLTVDAEPDLRPQACATACDCPAGQACLLNVCSTSQQIFCCGTAACTGADVCQAPDGRISQCALPADAGVRPDAGSTSTCAATACTPGLGSTLFCRLACANLTATCSGATGHCTP